MTRFAVKSFSLAMYLLAVCAAVMMVGCGSNSIAGTTPTTPPPTPATSKPVLVGLVAMGPTVDWTQTIPDALTYHPTEFEMWDTTAVTGGQAPLTQSRLASVAAQIKAQYPTTP